AAGSALSLSVLTTAAKFSYIGGSDPVTLIAVRATAGFLAVALIVLLMRQRPTGYRGNVVMLVAMSIGQLMINFGYMISVLYISVSLAALIFYVFPVLVLVIDAATKRRTPSLLETLVFAAAFVGLAMALGPSFDNLDWRGLSAALVAALGGTLMMLAGTRATRRAGALTTLFHMQMIACVVTMTVMLGFDGPALPTAEIGWWGLGAACAFYVIGVGAQIMALKLVDPAPASLIYNLEPLATIAIAAWLLSERLAPVQYLGGGLVLLAIIVASQRSALQAMGKT
ncbi:MAG: DMT family transporter, partial [Rhodospirillaceae bacterium]|nr:DMT family transporter [Rhodospirillaceae bacterium]